MTRERAAELLPVIQAYAEGKTVQCLHDGQWCDYDQPQSDLPFESERGIYQFRIKPEPRVWWARVYGRCDGTCSGHIFERHEEAATCSFMQPHEVIKVQEVL